MSKFYSLFAYMREEPLLKLLLSVQQQTLYPNEILIIDGSTDDATKQFYR
jgi:glycosyltransferase involved in cell wall biosynthesis